MELACFSPRSAVTQPRKHKEFVEARRYVRGMHIIAGHSHAEVKVRLNPAGHVCGCETARPLSGGENTCKKQSALCLVPPSLRARFSVDALGAAPAGFVR